MLEITRAVLAAGLILPLLATPCTAQEAIPLDFFAGPTGASLHGEVLTTAKRRWTIRDGFQSVQGPDNIGALVAGVSANGEVLYGGYTAASSYQQLWLWTQTGGHQYLGLNTTGAAAFTDASADGQVQVGWFVTGVILFSRYPIRRVGGVVQSLPTLLPFDSLIDFCMAHGVSADGQVTVGHGWNNAGGDSAVRWTSAGIEELWSGWALDVSADGSVVVGKERPLNSLVDRPVRWTAAGGVQDLGLLPGWTSAVAYGVSHDGQVVVGTATVFGGGERPFVWDPSGGLQELPIPPSLGGAHAYGVSGDGRLVYGSVLWDRSPNIGDRLCDPLPNSTGLEGRIFAEGSPVVADQDLTLVARYLPANRFGMFLNSREQGDVFPVPFSAGRLCLRGGIGRFYGPGQVQDTGDLGVLSLQVDVLGIPTPNGLTPLDPGDTWYFQAWHRDGNGSSNFTDLVAITFQ